MLSSRIKAFISQQHYSRHIYDTMVQAAGEAQMQNVVLLGGTGTVGSKILAALVKKRFNVTVLSRAESNAEFPSSVKVAKGDFNDAAFLQSALRGNEAFVITLGVMAPEDLQHKLLEAAAQAGVKYVLPNEFGQNNGDPQVAECIFVNSKKTQYREKAETLGLTWFGIANGFWTDYSAAGGYFGVDVRNRTADIWDDGKARLSVTTTDAAGHGAANLLALPKSKLDARANTFFLLSESAVSQTDLLEAAQKATGTTDDDWKIVRRSRQDAIAEAHDRMAKSDFSAFPLLLYATMFTPDLGSDFSGRNDNELLGLQTRSQDDLVQLFKDVVNGVIPDPRKRYG